MTHNPPQTPEAYHTETFRRAGHDIIIAAGEVYSDKITIEQHTDNIWNILVLNTNEINDFIKVLQTFKKGV